MQKEPTQEEIRAKALDSFFHKQAVEMAKRNYYGKMVIEFQAGKVSCIKLGSERTLLMKDIIAEELGIKMG